VERRFPKKDVSNDLAMWGRFERQGVYELKIDVFLQKEDGLLVLTTPGELGLSGYWGGPPSTVDYESNPTEYPEVKGVVKKGTLLIATQVIFWPDAEGGGTVEPRGTILTGQFEGKEVEMSDLTDFRESIERGKMILPVPNDRLLQKVTDMED